MSTVVRKRTKSSDGQWKTTNIIMDAGILSNELSIDGYIRLYPIKPELVHEKHVSNQNVVLFSYLPFG
jgi:hypothetical protein